MDSKQAELDRLPVVLLEAYEIVNITIPGRSGPLPVIDAVLTTESADQKRITSRVRMGPQTLAALMRDLQTALHVAQGSLPTKH